MTNTGAMMMFIGIAVSFVCCEVGLALLGVGFILAVGGRMAGK